MPGIDFGIVKPGTTLVIPFDTFDSNDPQASVTITGLAVTDIEVYKDSSMVQRASDAGYTLLDTDGIDLDTITGIHGISIDLSDNTTAGFYASGSQYRVVISSITVDAATVNTTIATFRIGYPDALLNTTIATLASQTSFTLTNGPAEDDALKNCIVAIHDVASEVQMGFAVVSAYTGATKTVTLTAGTTFTAAATDNIHFYPPANVTHVGATAQTANDNGADINALLTRIVGTLAAGTHNAQSGDVYGSLPANFASMVISAGGAVDSLVQGILNTLVTETTTGRLAENLSTLLDNSDAAATLTLDAIALAASVATAAELAKVPKSDGSTTWNATALAQIVNGILDEALTAGTHNVANSLARRIRAIQEYGGYEGGAVWIDTVNGTTGTTDYENGTVVFPCDTIANANTIATSIGLSNFIIIPGSNITFAASQISQVFNGTAWTLALGGQDISNTAIKGCQSVTGIATTPTGEAHFYDCEISTTTLGQVHLKQCGLSGTITLSASAVYTITASYSQTNTAPIIDFGAAVGSSEVDFVGWNGDIELQNMGQLGTDLVRWHGTGEITINANCVGGTLHIYGSPEITDNSGGAVTISYDDDTTDIKAILIDTGTTIPALITALNNVSTAEVLTQINTALDTAIAELGVGAPAATPSLRTGLMLLYMMARNRVDVDTTGTDALKIYNDAGTQIASKTITDDGTDYSESEMA